MPKTFTHTNNTPNYQYPMGRALAPGDSVELSVAECPELAPKELLVADEGSQDADPDADLAAEVEKTLSLKAKEIIELVPDMGPTLLEAVGAAEQISKDPRKTVLEAVAEEQLKRADEQKKADDKAAADALANGGNQ